MCIFGKIIIKINDEPLVFVFWIQFLWCQSNLVFFLLDSLTKRELKRQPKVELSPSRTQQPDPVNGQSAQRAHSREKREGRGSPPPLNRPLSLPLDPKVDRDDRSTSPSKSPLQRYKDMSGMRKKAERWKERQSDDSSPEMRRRQVSRKDDFQ